MKAPLPDRLAFWLIIPSPAVPFAVGFVSSLLAANPEPQGRFVEGSPVDLFVGGPILLLAFGSLACSTLLIATSPFARTFRAVPLRYSAAHYSLAALSSVLLAQSSSGLGLGGAILLVPVIAALCVLSFIASISLATRRVPRPQEKKGPGTEAPDPSPTTD